MKKYFILILIAISISLPLNMFSTQTGLFTVNYTDRDVTSSIYAWVQPNYDSAQSYPFLMAWHGAGDSGSNMRKIVAYILAERINAILLCPDANKVNGKDTSYFYNLLRKAYSFSKKNYNIDTNKTVIMGFSWGGAFSYQTGLLNTSMFKGIIGHAPAVGSLNKQQWDNIGNIRMATILGDKDFNFTAVNNLMNSIIQKGGNLLYIVKPNVTHVDNAYFNSQAIIDDYRQCYDYVINDISAVEDEISIKSNFQFTISPNPIVNFSDINCSFMTDGNLEIFVQDLNGKEICTIYNGFVSKGDYIHKINAQNITSGAYLLTIKLNNEIQSSKIIISK